MVYAEFIAALRLGTSRLSGIVGKRDNNGTFTVIAYETEEAAGCIRRGNIRNVHEAGAKIKQLVSKLQQKMPGNRISKLFVGAGGQSLRSEKTIVSRQMSGNSTVSYELLDELKAQLPRLDGLDVLDIPEPSCYLDGQLEANPVGIHCSKLDAEYQRIVLRSSFRSSIEEAVKAAGLKDGLAGILVSPLALAEAVLTEDEKEMGCALVDFGAGVTSVAAYKRGRLLGLCVLPMGGQLITKDLATHFGLVESDAEHIKREYGQAVPADDNASIISVTTMDKKELRVIPNKEFYDVIAARQREICENVTARLKDMTGESETHSLKHILRAGLFVTGNASRLRRMDAVLADCLGMNVSHIAGLRRDIDVRGHHPDMTPDNLSLGLLIQGDRNYINCSANVAKPPGPIFNPTHAPAATQSTAPQPAVVVVQPPVEKQVPAEEAEEKKPAANEKKDKKKKTGLLDKLGKSAVQTMRNMFDNVENNKLDEESNESNEKDR
ncbi:MAG: rod shape-determining protein [Tannerellaceae bacterium]|jgi:cell division protein FtsA|nr:rod shape-determining protein [Tannerellaceae bacterium]